MSKRTALPVRKNQSVGKKSPQLRDQYSPSRVVQDLMSKEECNWWQKCNTSKLEGIGSMKYVAVMRNYLSAWRKM